VQRQTEQIAGFVFLGLMLIFVILAITTFEGTPTVLLIVGAILFLAVGVFFISGPGRGDGDGQSQQQSVVFSDGNVVAQQLGGGRSCPSCGRGVQSSFAHCPHCGAAVAAR
jgi:hypothetical protein